MKFKAKIYRDSGGGYYAEVPDLPGTIAHGASLNELADNLREILAIQVEGVLDDYRERVGFQPPTETAVAEWKVTVSIDVIEQGAVSV